MVNWLLRRALLPRILDVHCWFNSIRRGFRNLLVNFLILILSESLPPAVDCVIGLVGVAGDWAGDCLARLGGDAPNDDSLIFELDAPPVFFKRIGTRCLLGSTGLH